MQSFHSFRSVLSAMCSCFAFAVAASSLSASDALTYDTLFNPNELLRVEITLEPDDWDELRLQGRSMVEAMAPDRHPDSASSPFTYYRADVKIDGVEIRDVAVKKKGFLGSLHRERPSLKLHFKKFKKGRKIAGLEKLTLNNNQQDPIAVYQVFAYDMFRKAGVAAPRGNHALVTVNGQELGIYSHVESVDDEFIKRHFSGEPGRLYEGTLTDFVPGWADKFETKYGRKNDYSMIDAVIQAAQAGDESLLDELGQVLNLDHFYRFWAIEVLLNHWDGYNGNRNNYFVYFHGDSSRMEFIPWGADSIARKHVAWTFNPPASVYASSKLSRVLYEHPVSRDQYRTILRKLLDDVWEEETLLDEIERIDQLLKPHVADQDTAASASRRSKNSSRPAARPSWRNSTPTRLNGTGHLMNHQA